MSIRFVIAAALALVAAVLPAAAQNFPSRTIHIIVAYAPGGTGDIVARLIAQPLGEALGQTVVVENRAGATGSIGTQACQIVRDNPDRFTIVALSAGGSDLELLARQAVEFEVPLVGAARGDRDDLVVLCREVVGTTGKKLTPEVVVGERAAQIVAGCGADVNVCWAGRAGATGAGAATAAATAYSRNQPSGRSAAGAQTARIAPASPQKPASACRAPSRPPRRSGAT